MSAVKGSPIEKPEKLVNPPTSPDREKFEAMLERLETIVTKMESSDLPLEQLLTEYEEGMKLVKECGDRLVEAEQFVEVLSRSNSVISRQAE